MDRVELTDRKVSLERFLFDLAKDIEGIIGSNANILDFNGATRDMKRLAYTRGPDHYETKIINIVLLELREITAEEFEAIKKGLPVAITHPESKSPEPGYILKD